MALAEVDARGDRLLDQLTHFARALHRVGLPVAPDKLITAVGAIMAVGIDRRDDFYSTLRAVFVTEPDQHELFDQVFHLFWQDPGALERIQDGVARVDDGTSQLSRRVRDALLADREAAVTPHESQREVIARLSWSYDERLGTKDFEAMSTEELAAAERAVHEMAVPIKAAPSRRFRIDNRGSRIDMRRTLRSLLRAGPGTIPLVRQRRRERRPPLVMLCDISGSMATYAAVFLHFAHAMSHQHSRVSTFLFATRLSNVTRWLRNRDVERALQQVGRLVEDWDSGTRIGSCLRAFNRDWSRRVLAQNAIVILLTDGLDREAGEGIAAELERLRKSCRRLVWLNPLLRYEQFQPLAAGVRAIWLHADEVRSIHNLKSVAELAAALSR